MYVREILWSNIRNLRRQQQQQEALKNVMPSTKPNAMPDCSRLLAQMIYDTRKNVLSIVTQKTIANKI